MKTEIFELTDATNDECYYTIGVFLTLEEAINAVASQSEPWDLSEDREDFIKLEIRKRETGKLNWSHVGEKVWEKSWSREWSGDEPEWKETKHEG